MRWASATRLFVVAEMLKLRASLSWERSAMQHSLQDMQISGRRRPICFRPYGDLKMRSRSMCWKVDSIWSKCASMPHSSKLLRWNRLSNASIRVLRLGLSGGLLPSRRYSRYCAGSPPPVHGSAFRAGVPASLFQGKTGELLLFHKVQVDGC